MQCFQQMFSLAAVVTFAFVSIELAAPLLIEVRLPGIASAPLAKASLKGTIQEDLQWLQ